MVCLTDGACQALKSFQRWYIKLDERTENMAAHRLACHVQHLETMKVWLEEIPTLIKRHRANGNPLSHS